MFTFIPGTYPYIGCEYEALEKCIAPSLGVEIAKIGHTYGEMGSWKSDLYIIKHQDHTFTFSHTNTVHFSSLKIEEKVLPISAIGIGQMGFDLIHLTHSRDSSFVFCKDAFRGPSYGDPIRTPDQKSKIMDFIRESLPILLHCRSMNPLLCCGIYNFSDPADQALESILVLGLLEEQSACFNKNDNIPFSYDDKDFFAATHARLKRPSIPCNVPVLLGEKWVYSKSGLNIHDLVELKKSTPEDTFLFSEVLRVLARDIHPVLRDLALYRNTLSSSVRESMRLWLESHYQ